MNRWLIHLDSMEKYHAGTKAMEDCEKVLINEGCKRLAIRRYSNKIKIIEKIQNEIAYGIFFKIGKGDILILQHPLYIGSRYLKWIKILKWIKKIHVVTIIHDLESLRGLIPAYKELFQEIDGLMEEVSDAIIVHNKRMGDYLVNKKNIDRDKIVELQVFDYLCFNALGQELKKHDRNHIAIAGNFAPEKAGYIYRLSELSENISYNLYGINFQEERVQKGNINYFGVFPPDILPSELKGDYGLVWDGDTIDNCGGNTGNYMRYNNPHKVSLYLASDLPVIIWEKAALADFICENGIGIVIGSLEELPEKLENISEEEYQCMKNNIHEIAYKVRNGEYIRRAYNLCERIIKDKTHD